MEASGAQCKLYLLTNTRVALHNGPNLTYLHYNWNNISLKNLQSPL